MRIPVSRLRTLAGHARRALEPRAVILMYHRVTTLDYDPWGLCVSPQHFDEQLQVLRRYKVLPLPLLLERLAANQLPRRAVAVTFDDGYADNVQCALPLLERHDIAATFFLTSDCIGREREFWWDALEQLVLEPETLPETLHVSIDGVPFRWELGEARHLSHEARAASSRWLAWEEAPTPRHALYFALWQQLIEQPGAVQDAVLEELSSWAGRLLTNRPTHATITKIEAQRLAQSAVCHIGGHTLTHPALPILRPDEQRREIASSKARLQEICGAPIEGFSYPYGRQNENTREIVQQAGFAWACTTDASCLHSASPRFELPRVQVYNWSGDEFEQHLAGFFNGQFDC